MKIDELQKKHPHYEDKIDEWRFLKASYEGGKAYEDSKLLYQYAFEKADDDGPTLYEERLEHAVLDNQCKTSIHTYSSFVWRRKPTRNLGELKDNEEAKGFIADADMGGLSFDEFMRALQISGHIYGHAWVVMDKAKSAGENSKKEEIDKGKRPYVIKYDPPAVWDWEYKRQENGAYDLIYLKTCDVEYGRDGEVTEVVRVWTTETVDIYKIIDNKLQSETPESIPNELGRIPAVCHYSRSRRYHGIGVSEIADVAKMQQGIYNMLSEMEQSIRNTNHNTMVLNDEDDASAGAGGVIVMAASTDPQKKPYLLQSQMFQLQGLINCIREQTDMINRMTHLSPVRNQRSREISGEALKTEFQLLNALLNEISARLHGTERSLLWLFCEWIDAADKFESVDIVYPSKFELRDTSAEMELLSSAKELNVKSPTFKRQLDKKIAALVLQDDTELDEVYAELDAAEYKAEEDEE